MLSELHHLLRGASQVFTKPEMAVTQLRSMAPARVRHAREQRLSRRFAADPLPGLGRQQLHVDRSWHRLVADGDLPARRLLLLHVPKTGGTSLRLMLSDHVPSERRFLSTGAYQWADTSIRVLARHELFVGHNFLEPLYLMPGEDWVTVLAVREPIAWWRSRYSYRRARALAAGDRSNPVVRQTMGRWIEASSDAELSNGQASWLLARVRLMFDNPRLLQGGMSDFGNDLSRDPQAALDLLDMLLARVTVVGVTDDLQAVYEAACRAMGWPRLHTVSARDNVTVHQPQILVLTDSQEQRLRNLNVLDQHMYDLARRRSTSPR